MRHEGPRVDPKKQPACRNCGVPCRPVYERVRERVDTEDGYEYAMRRTGRVLTYGYASLFCSGTCAQRFGLRCARAGVNLGDYDEKRWAWKRDREDRKRIDADAAAMNAEQADFLDILAGKEK